MPKHYAKKHLTKTADIFDMINTEDDDTTTSNGKEGRPRRESTDNDSSATQAK